jgi:hypothetical protein
LFTRTISGDGRAAHDVGIIRTPPERQQLIVWLISSG